MASSLKSRSTSSQSIDMLTFDEELHEYRWDGQKVPSVTTVIKPICDYSFVEAMKLEAACRRGTEVHKVCELYDLGTLDDTGIEDWEHFNYFNAWRKFRDESGFLPVMNEQKLYHKDLKYAGTLDRIGEVSGVMSVVDIKTTSVLTPAIGVQLAAYEQAVREMPELGNGKGKMNRYAVQLRPDGTYRLQQYKDSTDISMFVAMLNMMNFKRKHNINTKEK